MLLSTIENAVLRRKIELLMSGVTGRWRKVHRRSVFIITDYMQFIPSGKLIVAQVNIILRILLPNIIRLIKETRMRYCWHKKCLQSYNLYTEIRYYFDALRVEGKIILKTTLKIQRTWLDLCSKCQHLVGGACVHDSENVNSCQVGNFSTSWTNTFFQKKKL
jgi:hypothetical protein